LPTKILSVFLFSTMRAACTTHLMVLDLITRIILGEECKSWNPHYALYSILLLLLLSSAQISSSEPSVFVIACNMTTIYPLRFYHCNNITYYKHDYTLSLTSALDGGLHGLIHGEIDKYGSSHGTVFTSLFLLRPTQVQIQSSALHPQTLSLYSTMFYFSTRKSSGYSHSFVCCDLCAFI
jgi:hypothetical protein